MDKKNNNPENSQNFLLPTGKDMRSRGNSCRMWID